MFNILPCTPPPYVQLVYHSAHSYNINNPNLQFKQHYYSYLSNFTLESHHILNTVPYPESQVRKPKTYTTFHLICKKPCAQDQVTFRRLYHVQGPVSYSHAKQFAYSNLNTIFKKKKKTQCSVYKIIPYIYPTYTKSSI